MIHNYCWSTPEKNIQWICCALHYQNICSVTICIISIKQTHIFIEIFFCSLWQIDNWSLLPKVNFIGFIIITITFKQMQKNSPLQISTLKFHNKTIGFWELNFFYICSSLAQIRLFYGHSLNFLDSYQEMWLS